MCVSCDAAQVVRTKLADKAQELLDREQELYVKLVRNRAQALDRFYVSVSRTLAMPPTDAKELAAAREYVIKVPVLVYGQRMHREAVLFQFSLLDEFGVMYAALPCVGLNCESLSRLYRKIGIYCAPTFI